MEGGVAAIRLDQVKSRAGLDRDERLVKDGILRMGSLVESQIHSGVLQGISYALYEERHLDPATGVQLNANIDQYKIVGSRETPRIDVHVIEQLGRQSSTDARGVAEPANVATAAAIANAFYNATGKRIRTLPLTPANVLAALRG